MKNEIHEYHLPNGLLSFEPSRHRYIYDGEVIPGVTTLIKALQPTEILMAWAAKMTGEYIEQHATDINVSDPVELAELVREAKRQYRKKRDRMADIGTHVHAYIEGYVKALHWGTQYPELPQNEQAARACRGFVDWWGQQDIAIHSLEQKILCTGQNGCDPYAGTIDCDMTINGDRTLVDWKTSARLSASMGAQLGGYDLALEEMAPSVTYDAHMIVRADRDTGEIEVYKTQTKEEVHTNRYAFLACYRVWKYDRFWNVEGKR